MTGTELTPSEAIAAPASASSLKSDPSEPAYSGPLRVDWIDGLRGFAALIVLFNHSAAHLWRPGNYSMLTKAVYILSGHGHAAVNLFIVLSGFCLMIPSVRANGQLPGGLRTYARRRARRILPPYYACLFFSLLILQFTPVGRPTGTLFSIAQPSGPKDLACSIAAHALLVHDFYKPEHINYPLWSIAVEFHLYLLFPLLLIAWRHIGPTALMLASVISVLALRVIGEPAWFPVCWHYVALFCAGMFAASVAFGSPTQRLHRIARSAPDVAWFPLVAAATALSFVNAKPYWAPFLDATFGLLVALLLIRMVVSPQRLLKGFFQWAPLTFVGIFSYSLYLVHAPLIHLTYLTTVRPFTRNAEVGTLMLIPVSGAVCLLAAYMFHRKFELPYMKSVQPKPRGG